MPEQTFEIKPVGVKYICDKCGNGEMTNLDGHMLMVYPPQYKHMCSFCGAEKHLEKKYPTVEYRVI